MRLKNATCAAWTAAVAAVLVAGQARASQLTMLGPCLVTDVSANGSVAVGNLPGSYETFRWTQSDGVVSLGRGTVGPLGVGSGSPDVSWDGTKVSATVQSDDGTQAVAGRWTIGSGWQQLDPVPANSVPSGASRNDAWGMSGDGNSVVGLFWTTNSRAHATRWTSADGIVDLGANPNRSSRASAVNYDGSVIAGWDQDPSGFPNRRPAVWVNGVKTVLGTGVVDSELGAVNADGTIVGGSWRDGSDSVRGAALWRFNGTNWNLQKLGVLPGTQPDMPGAVVDDMSADGSVVVGFNRFDNNSPNDATGFYWSAATGMISADQLASNLGISFPQPFQILELTTVSPDGSTIGGIGVDAVGQQSFLITVPEPTGIALLFLSLPLLRHRRRDR